MDLRSGKRRDVSHYKPNPVVARQMAPQRGVADLTPRTDGMPCFITEYW